MNLFSYSAASDTQQALAELGKGKTAAYLGGGTNLIDDMKLGIEGHDRLVDVRKLGGFDQIKMDGKALTIGAAVTNSNLAYDENVLKHYPVLSQAILSGASPQLRNAATTAGNLLQRTRCYYFRDTASACNKRVPGSGCSAIEGYNRNCAVLGTSDQCIATHPSDMDVALLALDAVVHTTGIDGNREIAMSDFYIPYGQDPAKETVLKPGELITAVTLPATRWFARSAYIKARDRASYEFSLSSAAVALDVQNGTVNDCRVALGGVATKPWRAFEAEKILKGGKAEDATFKAAAAAELKAAKPQKFNAFKVELCQRVIVQTLKQVAAMA
jgi:xanthine dehydrogenase YagS FAD-binding subunit